MLIGIAHRAAVEDDRVIQQIAIAVGHRFGDPGEPRGDDRHPPSHRLEQRRREAVAIAVRRNHAGQNEDRRLRKVQRCDLLLIGRSPELDLPVQAE